MASADEGIVPELKHNGDYLCEYPKATAGVHTPLGEDYYLEPVVDPQYVDGNGIPRQKFCLYSHTPSQVFYAILDSFSKTPPGTFTQDMRKLWDSCIRVVYTGYIL
jgi:hypothetical protein